MPESLEKLEERLKQRGQELEQSREEYYVQPLMAQGMDQLDTRSEHQKKQKIGSIRAAVAQYMPETYTLVDAMRMGDEDMRKTRLHHARGQKLAGSDDTEGVLEFNIAGSSFQHFRNEKYGFHGKGTFRINGEDFKAGEDEKMEKLKTVKWYNKTRWLNWIPGIKTEPQILEENRRIMERNSQREDNNTKRWLARTAIDAEYGQQQVVGGKLRKHVRKKVISEHGKTRTRINLAGPLALNGLVNRGEYSIQNLRRYILTMGKDYLTGIFDKWESLQDCRNIPIIIKGHSRGAVAAAEGAMMLKQWVAENYPQYLPYVKFELVQYDPVPGFGSRFGVNEEFDHSGHKEYEKSGDKMRALGEGAETTVVYSLHTEHSSFFTPQAVKGAKRVILTPFKHGVGLDQIDQAAVRQRGETTATRQSHGASYTSAQSGEVYRGSGISELGEGVYIVDESNTLIQFHNIDEARAVIRSVLSRTSGQKDRHEVVMHVVEAWFAAHR